MGSPPFRLRVRIGDKEVEIWGEREEVLSALDDLEEIVEKVSEAFSGADGPRPKPRREAAAQAPDTYPKIPNTNQCGEAVVSLLSSEWGKTPRTISELREAMEANAVFFPKTTLSGVLVWLVKKGDLRRWKDKKRGYLYVLNRPGDE